MQSTSIRAGDTWQSTESLAAYPASSGWVAKLRLIPRAAGAAIDLVAAASGADHVFSATAATTGAWVAGAYTWVMWVELGAVSTTVGTGQLAVTPNLRTIGAGHDGRSIARKTLDDLLAARAAWGPASGGVRSYTINGRSQEFASPADLSKEIQFWEGQLERDTAAANLAAGIKPRNQLFVRFRRPR